MKRSAHAFTIIELLMVIAIIGILVSIAIPSYKQYTEKARFSEVIMATTPFKTAVSLALQDGISMDELNEGENGIPTAPNATKNLDNITVKQGVITATATKQAGSYTFSLTPDENGSQWSVSGSCVEAGVCRK
ncbi:MAG: pilin [Gammaproteobacteria bacterium]|nr:pilin [Gammaproteobacteria bacterium]